MSKTKASKWKDKKGSRLALKMTEEQHLDLMCKCVPAQYPDGWGMVADVQLKKREIRCVFLLKRKFDVFFKHIRAAKLECKRKGIR